MTVEEVRAIVEKHVDTWAEKLGVSWWKITVAYGPCSQPHWKASCDRTVDYSEATITIDPEHAETEADVMSSLIHELLHLALAPMDLYRDVVSQDMGDADGVRGRQEARLWTFAVEQSLTSLHRIVTGMGGPW